MNINIARARCEQCPVEVELRTLEPLVIERLADGGGVLLDAAGRAFHCPFCDAPLSGSLTRMNPGLQVPNN